MKVEKTFYSDTWDMFSSIILVHPLIYLCVGSEEVLDGKFRNQRDDLHKLSKFYIKNYILSALKT